MPLSLMLARPLGWVPLLLIPLTPVLLAKSHSSCHNPFSCRLAPKPFPIILSTMPRAPFHFISLALVHSYENMSKGSKIPGLLHEKTKENEKDKKGMLESPWRTYSRRRVAQGHRDPPAGSKGKARRKEESRGIFPLRLRA